MLMMVRIAAHHRRGSIPAFADERNVCAWCTHMVHPLPVRTAGAEKATRSVVEDVPGCGGGQGVGWGRIGQMG